MSALLVDGFEIQIVDIDFLLEKSIDGNPCMIFHLRSGETSSCEFPSIADQEIAWETIRTALAKDDFYECPQLFFRLDAVVVATIGESSEDGPYVQMGFRGGMLLRRPFSDKAMRDEDFAGLEKILGNRQHSFQ
jgi:hypothetical protein